MAATATRYVIRDAKQVRALTGPLQHQIVSTLERDGTATARELAERIGVAPDVLYYHLRKLESVGLLLTSGTRPTARRPERVFSLPARELVIDPEDRRPAFLSALAALQRSNLALATRLYERSVRDGVRSGRARNLCVIQQFARLRPPDLAELNRKLEDIAAFVAERDDPDLDAFVSLTVSMSPVRRD